MRFKLHVLGVLIVLVTPAIPATACTGIQINPADGSVICARTLEFGMDLASSVIVIPRGLTYVGSTPDGEPGHAWTTRYGTAGANAFGMPIVIDGTNERGLGIGAFYFPDYAQYENVSASDLDKTLAPWELPTFLLGTCATVAEAVDAAHAVRVAAVVQRDMGIVPPCHFVVHDASGKWAVLEYVDGTLHVHDNPLGVFTNSPTFDWHLTNLRNYVNLRVANVPPVEMLGVRLSGFGQGNGLVGLPGDFTPPSRFVRAVAFTQSATPTKTAREGVLQAFHILNQFDIPRGAVRSEENGQTHDDYTLWTSAADLANHRYYFRTYANSRVRVVELDKLDLDAPKIKTISMGGEEVFEVVTGAAK